MIKNALIPGASRPIGRAIARRFARAGYRLFLPVYDWPESIQEMVEEFKKDEINFSHKKIDLRQKKEVRRYLAEIEDSATGLDLLVNNIERGGMPTVHGSYDLPHNQDQWQRELETTLNSKCYLYQYALPLLQKRAGANIITISSIAGETGRSGPAALLFSDGYSAANSALRPLLANWAREAAPVRVNELILGIIDGRHGKGTRGWANLEEEEREAIRHHTLLNRTGTPTEVADATLFFARSDFITGASLRIDGGYCLGGVDIPQLPPGILG